MGKKIVPKIRNFLICEEVRQEISRKYILVGVFQNLMLVSQIPATVPIALYMEFFPVPLGALQITLKFSGPGEGVFEMSIMADIHEPSMALVVPSPRIDVTMECEGDFVIEVKFDDGEFQEASRLGIKVDESISRFPYTNVSVQPSEQSLSVDRE